MNKRSIKTLKVYMISQILVIVLLNLIRFIITDLFNLRLLLDFYDLWLIYDLFNLTLLSDFNDLWLLPHLFYQR